MSLFCPGDVIPATMAAVEAEQPVRVRGRHARESGPAHDCGGAGGVPALRLQVRVPEREALHRCVNQ